MQSKRSNLRDFNSNIRSDNEESVGSPKSDKRDIDKLFGSAARIDLLWAYMQNPDKWLGPRELQRLTGRSLSDIQRNNVILAEMGLIEIYAAGGSCAPEQIVGALENTLSEKRVYRSHFILNQDHPWLPALRMLLERSIGSVHILQEYLESVTGIEVAFIFGSYATSEQRPDSDIDLTVIGEHTILSLAEPLDEIERRVGREINVIARSPAEWREKLKARDHFVMSLIDSPKIYLVGDASKLESITLGRKSEA
jgi:predicted nucleotidyltransferase